MYVINPTRDAKELKEFMERWHGENSRTLGSFRLGDYYSKGFILSYSYTLDMT